MKHKFFMLTLTNEDSEVLDMKHIAVVEDWMDVPEDFNDDNEFDFVFDYGEIKTLANADMIAPDIEESIFKVIKRHLGL